MNEAPSPLRDAPWVAELLGLTVNRVYEYAKSGVLPCVRIGKYVKFSEGAIRSFIEQGGRGLEDQRSVRIVRNSK